MEKGPFQMISKGKEVKDQVKRNWVGLSGGELYRWREKHVQRS